VWLFLGLFICVVPCWGRRLWFKPIYTYIFGYLCNHRTNCLWFFRALHMCGPMLGASIMIQTVFASQLINYHWNDMQEMGATICEVPASLQMWVNIHIHTCTATHCNTLQRTATHYNTLQHTATHCNTLQHTATQCNTMPIVSEWTYIHIYIYVWVSECTYIYVYIYKYKYVCIYVYIYTYEYKYICIYVFMYIYIYIYL